MYYLIDKEGHYIDYVLSIEGNEIPRHVTTRPPDGMYKAKWNEKTSEWIETKTQEAFEEEEFLQSLIPNAEKIAGAELEIKVLNILMEVDLI